MFISSIQINSIQRLWHWVCIDSYYCWKFLYKLMLPLSFVIAMYHCSFVVTVHKLRKKLTRQYISLDFEENTSNCGPMSIHTFIEERDGICFYLAIVCLSSVPCHQQERTSVVHLFGAINMCLFLPSVLSILPDVCLILKLGFMI